jgi:phosphodiesterase/alkaline phosphatase D-like protein
MYMNTLIRQLAITVTAVSVLYANPTAAQVTPSEKKAARVRITRGPELELTRDDLAIIRWTSNNPGGSPEHYGVVHYGTNPKDLSQVAKSPIRLNPDHPQTIFRVRVEGLKPRTTYYYMVESMEANGASDRVKSSVKKFTTSGPGERIAADPPHSR